MALLKMLTMTEKAIPFSALLGAVFAFWRLNRNNEFVVARAAGVSIWQFLAPPIAFAILIGLFKISVFNPFSSAMLLKYEILEAKHIRGKSSLAALANEGLWFRQSTGDGHYILHARNIIPREMRIERVIVFLMQDADRFVARIDAPSADLEDGFWRLERAVVTAPNRPPAASTTLGVYLPTLLREISMTVLPHLKQYPFGLYLVSLKSLKTPDFLECATFFIGILTLRYLDARCSCYFSCNIFAAANSTRGHRNTSCSGH